MLLSRMLRLRRGIFGRRSGRRRTRRLVCQVSTEVSPALDRGRRTRVARAVRVTGSVAHLVLVLGPLRVQVLLRLLGELHRVLALVRFRHGGCCDGGCEEMGYLRNVESP